MSPTLININDPVCRRGRERRPISLRDTKSPAKNSTNGRKAENRLFRSASSRTARGPGREFVKSGGGGGGGRDPAAEDALADAALTEIAL